MNNIAGLARKILTSALKERASDIHFHPADDRTKIYFRILGKRKVQKDISLSQYHLLLTYFKYSSNMDIGENRKPQSGSMQTEYNNFHYSLRLSTLPNNDTESLAVRILNEDRELPLDKLFLFQKQFDHLKSLAYKGHGIILLTGATGSGKTTTLYALISALLEENPLQVITLEDPIERKLNNVIQIQINKKANITYATGLKAILRHDPDILLIGEIRDANTAKFAFEAALTGHLVLSTLHAKDGIGTIHRLLDFGLSETEISQSLLAVGATELVPLSSTNKTFSQRAAILELLTGDNLGNVTTLNKTSTLNYTSFKNLRKKAYAYGFINKEDAF